VELLNVLCPVRVSGREREEGTCMANPATRVSCFGSNSSSLSGSTSKATEHFSFIILA